MKIINNNNTEIKDLKNNKINLKDAMIEYHNIYMDAEKQNLEYEEYYDKLSEKVKRILGEL